LGREVELPVAELDRLGVIGQEGRTSPCGGAEEERAEEQRRPEGDPVVAASSSVEIRSHRRHPEALNERHCDKRNTDSKGRSASTDAELLKSMDHG
jgi:hypothetical protein